MATIFETPEEAAIASVAVETAEAWFDEVMASSCASMSVFRRAGEGSVAISYASMRFDERRDRGVRRALRSVPQTHADAPRLVIITGWSESWLKYKEVVRDFACGSPDGHTKPLDIQGVYMMDHASQGLSGRYVDDPQLGHVPDFDTYVRDIAYFIQHIVFADYDLDDPSRPPLYLLAHSMGGLAATRYAVQHPGVIDRLLLSSPMLGMKLPGPLPVIYGLARIMCSLGKGSMYLPPKGPGRGPELDPVPVNRCSMSKVRLGRWEQTRRENGRVIMSGQSFQWLLTSLQSRLDASTLTEHDIDALRYTRGGIFIVSAELEILVDNAAHAHMAKSLGPSCCTRVIIKGGKHETLVERESVRKDAMREITNFFSSQDTESEERERVLGVPTGTTLQRRMSNFVGKVVVASLSCPYMLVMAACAVAAAAALIPLTTPESSTWKLAS